MDIGPSRLADAASSMEPSECPDALVRARTVPLGGAREDVVVDPWCPARLLAAREQTERLERTLESLDRPQREIILLRYYEGLSYRETWPTRTGCPIAGSDGSRVSPAG